MSVEIAQPKQSSGRKSAVRLSKDGKWRSFPRVPHLLQYLASGKYYARIKINGKIFRESLDTAVWSVAQLKLVDFLKSKRTAASRPNEANVLFSTAAQLFKARVEKDSGMKERSKKYRFLCMRKINSSWPTLAQRSINSITAAESREWAAKLNQEIASQYFNNVTGTLRLILDEGIREQTKLGGEKIENPAAELSRAKIVQKALQLPSPEQFQALITAIRDGSSWGPKAANLVEFLAYSGTRLFTEAQWITWEDIDWQRKEIIVRGHPETGTKNWQIRRVPILPAMETLLRGLQSESRTLQGKLLEITTCPISLGKACAKVGISRLRHHDLRHLFATRCIESGVDIPTVSRWLGHKDGGALAMRVYGHLRNEHSQQMAQKVKF